jgi:hypothetical protein
MVSLAGGSDAGKGTLASAILGVASTPLAGAGAVGAAAISFDAAGFGLSLLISCVSIEGPQCARELETMRVTNALTTPLTCQANFEVLANPTSRFANLRSCSELLRGL